MSERNWKSIPLQKLCNRIGDGIHGTPKYVELSDYYFINGNNLKNGFIEITSDTKNVDSEEYKKHFIEFDSNTLFLSINGTLGSMAKYKGERIILGKSAAYIKCDSIEIDFLYYYLQLENVQKRLHDIATGSTIKNLSLESIRTLTIPSPLQKNQKKIAAVLSSLDAKIELNNRINAELEAMAKTLYDYWFVQFDFPISKEQAKAMGKPELTGKPYKSSGGKMVYDDTLKREIPEWWEVYSLSKLLRYNYSSIGKQDSYKIINYLDTSSLTKNYLGSTQPFNVEKDKIPSRAKRIVGKNDILYSTVRPNQFHYGIIKHPIKNLIASTGFVQLNSKMDWVSNDLIYTFLTSSWVTKRLQQIAELSVSSYPSISPKDILDLQIALPKQEKDLDFINLKFDMVYNMVSTNHSENQHLINLRDWLLPMLMNGQVTVK